eukprot:COSAG06_NODE_59_length_27189_cov_21.724527_9_plen_114_part_00
MQYKIRVGLVPPMSAQHSRRLAIYICAAPYQLSTATHELYLPYSSSSAPARGIIILRFLIARAYSLASTILCDAPFSDPPKKKEPKSALVLIRGGSRRVFRNGAARAGNRAER